ncbi:MAG: CAP domain-containing protein, partial [Rectinemataceae bacterium]|nr:CAP domain-containing protein [Rectinemataceae bacterium]
MHQPDLGKNLIPFAGLFVLIGGVVVLAVITAPLLESPQNPAAVSSAEVALLTNKERSEKDIPVLQRNSLLDQAAQMKAQDMAANGYYAHVSPDGLTPMHWVGKAGYKYLIIGENLVVNRTDAEQVVDAFMGSPGHRANILRTDFTEIGIGVANGVYKGKDATFTVQIFAAPYPQKEVPKVAVKPVSAPTKTTETPKPVATVS